MQRIVFYEPAASGNCIWQRFGLPRLGSIVLGTILKMAGYDVKIYVENIRPPSLHELLDADLLCLSPLTPSAPRAYEIAKIARATGVPVAIGGPHVTFLPEEALQYADYVFRGEAENSIVELVRAIGTGEGLDSVLGLSYRRDGKIHHNAPAEPVCDLDSLPDPDFSLLDRASPRYLPVSTSRGCPYDCKFCSVTRMFGRKYRFRSAARVLDELARMDFSHSRIFFYDDNFSANGARLYELLEGILSRGIRFSWSAQARADVGRDERLLALMRRAGCRTLYVGFESVNPDTLKAYRKRQTLSEIKDSIRRIHNHGLRVYGMFVLGSDTDTVDTVRETLRFALNNRIDTMQLTILTPLPGTACFEELEQQGRILHKNWALYDFHHVVFEPARMSALQLRTEVCRALSRFYSLPRILGDALRFRFFEAKAKTFNRWYHVRAAQGAL